MASSPGFAEISVEGHACRLYGCLVQMSPEGAVVRLERGSTSDRNGQVPSGSPASLTIVTGSALFTASARVVSEAAGDVALAFSSNLTRVQRRGEKRMECDLGVMLRARRPDGRTGAWQTGSTYDVSVSGICLKLEQPVDPKYRIEVCFVLPLDETDDPIRATGRVAYQRVRADGQIAVGVAFTAISARDKMRLVRFIK